MAEDTKDIKLDADKVVHDSAAVVHDAERNSRHGLSHLEDEFIAEVQKIEGDIVAKLKAGLAWLDSKL